MEHELVILQDKTTKMYYVALAASIKSKENLIVVGKYTDPAKALDDLEKYSTGRKSGGMDARLTLKDIAQEMMANEAEEDL